jgi:shikimate dehydrogenase
VVLPLLDHLSDEAAAMGAANTVVLRNGQLHGHNTDGSGWAWGFKRALPDADTRRVVLLGAGGAGAAIAHAVLRSLGAAELVINDRDSNKAAELAQTLNRLYGPGRAVSEKDPAEALAGASGLIHATPTGMDKLPGMPLPETLLRPELWVSEIVYFPIETALLKAARRIGCRTVDGGHMAVGQAVGAFELFTGRKADPARMDQHFRQLLS